MQESEVRKPRLLVFVCEPCARAILSELGLQRRWSRIDTTA